MKHLRDDETLVDPDLKFNFGSVIDIMDETLREGAERATITPDFDSKLRLAAAIANAGVKSIVVGMFPDVPHNEVLLARLIDMQSVGEIPADVRFMVISHVGVTMNQTLAALERIPGSKRSVWIIVIHPVSDLQIHFLFPMILRKDPKAARQCEDWESLGGSEQRKRHLQWFDEYLPSLRAYRGGGIMIGLIDAFRADHGHLRDVVDIVARHGIPQIRLLDTAGTCTPHALPGVVGDLLADYPEIGFYGHFHDDFGLATANCVVGLALGMRGVDVSVSGFGNRAGHAPLAEVVMALRHLYGVELPGFAYQRLNALSRLVERTYGLIEKPTQPLTGVITHAVLTGIRTELLSKAPRIFDVIDPSEVGAELQPMFGVRSGRDGLLRFLRKNSDLLARHNIELTAEFADRLYGELDDEWLRRSVRSRAKLIGLIEEYQLALMESSFSETEMVEWVKSKLSSEVLS